jgi:hypothetical protein
MVLPRWRLRAVGTVIRRLVQDARHAGYWRELGSGFLAVVGVIAMGVTLVAAFLPKLLSDNRLLAVSGFLIAATFAFVRAWPRTIRQEYEAGFFIEVCVGDILDEKSVVVIGMCDTFEVSSPRTSPSSLQGQFLVRTWSGDSEGLLTALEIGLGSVDETQTEDSGSALGTYPIGTVVPVRKNKTLYLCVAYSSMDSHSNTRASLEGMTQSLFSVWSAANRYSNGAEIAIPLVGQQQSRLNALPPEAALRLISLTFVLRSNSERVGLGLRIVLAPNAARRLDVREFKRYLGTLPCACTRGM